MKTIQHNLEELHSGASQRHIGVCNGLRNRQVNLVERIFHLLFYLPVLVFCWLQLLPLSGSFFPIIMGPRIPSPDRLTESEGEGEEDGIYLSVNFGEQWDSSEEEDPVVSNLTTLESLAWQVKCLLKYSTTWRPLNPNSWLYHAKLLDPNTPVHILREIGLRLSYCSHCVPKLEPIPEWPPLASCGVPPFQKPLTSPSRLSRDHATLNGALQFATKQLGRTLSKATPIPEFLTQIPDSCVSGCCCGWLTKTVKETTRTEPFNTTYSYTDFQKAVNKLLTASL